jgi:iron complex transport system substrate-binding protein
MHEDTYRGGSIWTICSACGMKWADDNGRGGFVPYQTPKAIEDAGASYFYEKNTENTYLDNEQILLKSQNAVFWIHLGIASSLKEAQNMFPMANQLPPFKNKKCYNNTVQKNKFGANNYWEMGVVYPDLVLDDLAQIFHNPNFEKGYFYEKLK